MHLEDGEEGDKMGETKGGRLRRTKSGRGDPRPSHSSLCHHPALRKTAIDPDNAFNTFCHAREKVCSIKFDGLLLGNDHRQTLAVVCMVH